MRACLASDHPVVFYFKQADAAVLGGGVGLLATAVSRAVVDALLISRMFTMACSSPDYFWVGSESLTIRLGWH